MLFVANTLELNGGTTFLIRLCRELKKSNTDVAVLVLMNKIDEQLLLELKKYATVYFLINYMHVKSKIIYGSQLGIFSPLNLRMLNILAQKYGSHLHIMGVFGLLFAERIVQYSQNKIRVSIGIYHQNEFMYQNVKYNFSNYAQKLFKNTPSENIIFFNDINKNCYQYFFSKDYSGSTVAPIGIDLPNLESLTIGDPYSQRIISIGNLFDFKTYNSHIIKLMPTLVKIMPNITYEIYGAGPYENNLRSLVSSLNLTSIVRFMGPIGYDDFQKTLKGAFLFVGSGTAILEAAALGIPSIIGIESSSAPLTYGYISDIDGFSYNEDDPRKNKVLIIDKILSIALENGLEYWHKISLECKRKSTEFSVDHTAAVFNEINGTLKSVGWSKSCKYERIFRLYSLLTCALFDKIGIDKTFSNRRDQGTFNFKKIKL